MASFLLPQAMLAVSGNQSMKLQFPPLKNLLEFSTHRLTSRGNSLSFDSVLAVPLRKSVVVRSENGSENVTAGDGENEGEIDVEGGVVRSENVTVGDGKNESEVEVEAVVEDSVENLESEAEPESEVEPRPPRKPRIKMGEIMGILNKKAVEASEEQRPVPAIRTGDVVEIKLEVPENRRRLSVYKGIVISRQNAGIHTTIRIRRIIAGVGVEIVFPLYSPNIKEIKVVSHRKVRKARLYYLRDKLPRLSTFK